MENTMKVKSLIKHLINAPIGAEVVVFCKDGRKIRLDTMCGFYRGENAEIHLFEAEENEK